MPEILGGLTRLESNLKDLTVVCDEGLKELAQNKAKALLLKRNLKDSL